ncbi:MAG: RIO1 family regulatory kinase/ATPase [Marinobacter sp.]
MNGQLNCPSMGTGLELAATGLSAGQKWYKPILSVDTDSNGDKHVYKAFRFSQGLLGRYFRFLASHEFRMLKRVEHLDFTPSQISRGPDAVPTINYRLIEGTSIKDIAAKDRVPENFFLRLFNDVKTLHQHGVVHMDLGNSGNILVSTEGYPVIIDFGSAVPSRWLPSMVQGWARRKDILGVLKLWYRFDKTSMPTILVDYFQKHYRKNIYTPKRFLKAMRRWMMGHGSTEDLSGLTTVVSVFVGLLVLVTFT